MTGIRAPDTDGAGKSTSVARYRLRFLLQEIDLPQGETIIGRSATCHVTIEDPLVSRQHARIRLAGDVATVEDMGSRNGLLVNGRLLEGRTQLSDGDRIRVGTQEFVFCTVAAPRRTTGPGTRATGFMCHCAACGVPYAAELDQCPSCGSQSRVEEDTISGVVSGGDRNWTLELLVEVLDRALSLERWEDVERMLRRARANIEERMAAGDEIQRIELDQLATAAARLALHTRDAEWAAWLLGAYASLGIVPDARISRSLSTLPPVVLASIVPEAERLVQKVRARGGPAPEDSDAFTGLLSLAADHTGDR